MPTLFFAATVIGVLIKLHGRLTMTTFFLLTLATGLSRVDDQTSRVRHKPGFFMKCRNYPEDFCIHSGLSGHVEDVLIFAGKQNSMCLKV